MSLNAANRRVVVTGIGLVTPLGLNVQENWTNLLKGKSSVKKLVSEEYNNLPCRIAAQIDRDKLYAQLLSINILKNSDLKSMSIANIYALAAADQALKDSGWSPQSDLDEQRAGASIAIGMSGLIEIANAAQMLRNDPVKAYKHMSPYFVPKILGNLSSGLISIKYKLKGPNHCLTTACAAGSHSICDAFQFIQNGVADVMVCGATEACIHPVSIAGFSRMRALATKFNDMPESASRPFDKDRDGFIMSEGSGILVLESLENVQKRKAESNIYAEILGTGLNADSSHITNPSSDGEGAYRCMKMALDRSRMSLNDIRYVNAHATSTPVGDKAEISAIKRLFRDSNRETREKVYLSSVKGSIGHLLGAAGAVESIITILACRERVLPPSINIKNLDADLELNEASFLEIVQHEPLDLSKIERSKSDRFVALKNSFGFGGTNASIVMSNFI